MAESEEELKSLLMKVKEESEKVGFVRRHGVTKVPPPPPDFKIQVHLSEASA